MAVGDLERFVARHLEAEGYRFSINSTFEWLSGWGPFEPLARRPQSQSADDSPKCTLSFGGDLQKLQNKRRSPLRVDFDLKRTHAAS